MLAPPASATGTAGRAKSREGYEPEIAEWRGPRGPRTVTCARAGHLDGVAELAIDHDRGRGEINTNHGGRGVYFDDPSGHHLEALTARYEGYPALT